MKRFIFRAVAVSLAIPVAITSPLWAQSAQPTGGSTNPQITKVEASRQGDGQPEQKNEAEKNSEAEKDATTREEAEQAIEPLTIGSVAPELDIMHWIHDGDGAFDPVSKFENNKVYVVEFWATWCGPCIAAMPHIVALQKEYADRDVQIISVSSEPMATIEAFLKREVPGAKEGDDAPQTYQELTSSYCLTTDPDRSTSKSYMEASGQNGIPCAFLVGKSGKIEWIGHPMSIDEPLAKVVNDDWDRDAFAEKFKEDQHADMVFQAFVKAMRSKETDKALQILDDYIATGKLAPRVSQMQMVKLQVLAGEESRSDELKAYVASLLKDESLGFEAINRLAWTIARYAEAGKITDKDTVRAALKKTQAIVDDTGASKPFVMDTIAHLQQALGDRAAAIATQTAAVELAEEGRKDRLQRYLDELLEAQEAAAQEAAANDAAEAKDKAEGKDQSE
ncbi:thiol-disulfide oxidoreductase [Novipirellula galeiformis]|uniref:Thiol-disulfide oxidoreductase n=1 Tax=Novipirellula galeiformis TaxID=2528004 RepID=A0A5C6C9H8_9BACT|nr:TlpA disulfide reductase family protein [Novipirellula galeiformis]TWU20111.1 thiol-disulfide oxidoreductase [Novipirellula galeiformis]